MNVLLHFISFCRITMYLNCEWNVRKLHVVSKWHSTFLYIYKSLTFFLFFYQFMNSCLKKSPLSIYIFVSLFYVVILVDHFVSSHQWNPVLKSFQFLLTLYLVYKTSQYQCRWLLWTLKPLHVHVTSLWTYIFGAT